MSKLLVVKNVAMANACTHAGVFHADDVFSTVLLRKLRHGDDMLRVIRVNRVPEDLSKDAIVYDIGGGEFDHHQKDAKLRPTGRKYAAFGLLWQRYGRDYLEPICSSSCIEDAFNIFDKSFVEGIDAIDNGEVERGQSDVQVMGLSGAISTFNPTWDDQEEDADVHFAEAVYFAESIFNNAIKSAISKAEAKELVEACIDTCDGPVMELDVFMPWEQFLFESKSPAAEKILYVIHPSNRGGYVVRAVPDKPGSFGMRKPFPEAWAGLRDEELAKISGVEKATFCHAARFICSAETRSAARKLAWDAARA